MDTSSVVCTLRFMVHELLYNSDAKIIFTILRVNIMQSAEKRRFTNNFQKSVLQSNNAIQAMFVHSEQ